MKRILSIVALAAIVACTTGTSAFAGKHVTHKGRARSMQFSSAMRCPVSDPSACGSSCPRGASAATASAKAESMKPAMNGGACPVSDPSACPSSCPRTGSATAAVAANHPAR